MTVQNVLTIGHVAEPIAKEDLSALMEASRRFGVEGYGLLPGFLDQALLHALRQEVDDRLRAPAPPGCDRPHNSLFPLRWDDRAVELILEGEQRRRSLAELVGASDLRWISAYVSTKAPHTAPLWWHQDWWCWDHPVSFRAAPQQVALLCYLGSTDEDRGALRILPGSHRASLPLHAVLPEAHAEGARLPVDHSVLSDQPGQVTLSARAGDAVVLDYRLLHGTHANRSAVRRDCLLLSFTPCWRDLPPDLRAHLVRHPAQPTPEERPLLGSWRADLLPSFDGVPADLPLNRVAPARFAIAGSPH